MSKNKYGYQEGDLFTTTESPYFTKGSIVRLEKDDGSWCPLFKLVTGEGGFDGSDKAYDYYESFKPLHVQES